MSDLLTFDGQSGQFEITARQLDAMDWDTQREFQRALNASADAHPELEILWHRDFVTGSYHFRWRPARHAEVVDTSTNL